MRYSKCCLVVCIQAFASRFKKEKKQRAFWIFLINTFGACGSIIIIIFLSSSFFFIPSEICFSIYEAVTPLRLWTEYFRIKVDKQFITSNFFRRRYTSRVNIFSSP